MLEKKVITEKSEPLVLTGDTRVQAWWLSSVLRGLSETQRSNHQA
jgi:hypothetical protein